MLSGFLVDRIHAPYVAAVFFFAPLVGIVVLLTTLRAEGGALATVLVGIGVGAEVDLIAFLLSRYLGMRSFGEIYGYFFAIFMLASVGLPGTSGFVGEFLSLTGTWPASSVAVVFAASGVVLGATYMLLLYRRVVFGGIVHEEVRTLPDLSAREIAVFVPMILLVLAMGIQPNLFLGPMASAVQNVAATLAAHMPH